MNDLDFPSPRERDLPPGRHLRLREHLLSEIRQDEGAARARAPRTGKAWRRPALVAGAVAAAVAAGLVVAQPFGGQPAQAGPPSEETVRMLEEIAAAAQKSPAPKDVRDDQFVYIKSKVGFLADSSDEGPGNARLEPLHLREYWQSVDGRHTEVLHEPLHDKKYERMEPEEPLPEDGNYRNVEKLPTDPVNMLDWLHKVSDAGENGEDQATFALVGDLTREALMPPKQAAALYLAASRIPGVVLVEDAVDAAGRHGVAIAREDEENGIREELIFDKETKEYLGEREVATEDKDGHEEGAVIGSTAVLERTIVDKAGERP